MWTYLLLLASVVVLFGIFLNRYFSVFQWKQGLKKIMSSKKEAEPGPIQKNPPKIKSADKTQVALLCTKAEAKLRAGREDEAIKFFVQALAIDECHQETQHRLAILYMKKQMFGAAAALFRQLAELSNDPIHYSHLGLAHFQQNEHEEAKLAYQKAIELDPARAPRFASLSQVYRALNQLQNAVIALKMAIEMDEENLDYLLLLADIQTELANYEEAKEILAKVLSIEPANKDAKAMLTVILSARPQQEF